jgi:hypothetical protein
MQFLALRLVSVVDALPVTALVNLVWAFGNAGIPNWAVLDAAANVVMKPGQPSSLPRGTAVDEVLRQLTDEDVSILHWAVCQNEPASLVQWRPDFNHTSPVCTQLLRVLGDQLAA